VITLTSSSGAYINGRNSANLELLIRLKENIHQAFSHRNYGSKSGVLGYNSTYFSNKVLEVYFHTDCSNGHHNEKFSTNISY
jgi:hypothetical protein